MDNFFVPVQILLTSKWLFANSCVRWRTIFWTKHLNLNECVVDLQSNFISLNSLTASCKMCMASKIKVLWTTNCTLSCRVVERCPGGCPVSFTLENSRSFWREETALSENLNLNVLWTTALHPENSNLNVLYITNHTSSCQLVWRGAICLSENLNLNIAQDFFPEKSNLNAFFTTNCTLSCRVV